jgi:hypothetical protein
MSIDPDTGDLYVANDMGQDLIVFHSADQGDVAPSRMIKGPNTGLSYPVGVSVDSKEPYVWAIAPLVYRESWAIRRSSISTVPARPNSRERHREYGHREGEGLSAVRPIGLDHFVVVDEFVAAESPRVQQRSTKFNTMAVSV